MELIEHKRLSRLSTWHGVCSSRDTQTYVRIGAMKRVHVVFHDGGGGHRNAAVALQTIVSEQKRDWQVELIQFQDLTDRLDVLRKLTGIRIQQQYIILLQNGWTLGSTYLLRVLQATIRLFHKPLVRLLENFWREHPADLRKLDEHLSRPPICHAHYRLGGLSTSLLDRANLGTIRHCRDGKGRRA